ncbi:MAG TPA: hypothetical protein VFI69_06980 [Candidatus Limnocylindrales bacterium]|nr:hypothetical protein [Candidatus Limnocylindrales bacterium]
MARAKRTARADARRRHRTELGLTDEAATIEATPTAPSRDQRTRPAAPPPTGRVGIGAAFRQAFRPLDVRGDLRALPDIAIHSKALWVPVALTILSAVLYIVIRPAGRTDIAAIATVFLFQYFLQTPAIGGVFIAGFLAPRASWLLGLIVGAVSAACYSFLGLAGYIGIATNARAEDVIIAAFIMSPIMGAIFASAAAWYRRFLQLSGPNRGRQQAAAPRRGDGRTRTSGSNQKAGARR